MQLNNKLRIFGGIAVGVSLVIWLTCNYNEPVAGGSTETTNSKVSGFLYNPHGSPAVNASIKIVSVDYNPKPDGKRDSLQIDSTLTDENGRFLFASLSSGYFNILGEGDSGYAYQDSLYIPPDDNFQAPPDTLKAPGSIRGIVRLQPEDNPELVFIVVLGTPVWTMPDDPLGNFILLNMAEGAYRVRFLTTLDDYNPLDTVLTITTGVNAVLPDTLFLPYIGIPKPKDLAIVYDTLRQIVTLQWASPNSKLVKGFNVYRRHSDSSFTNVPINPVLILDTMYHDSTASQDQQYEYKVTAVDTNDEEGEKSQGQSIVIVPAFTLVDSLGSEGTGIGQFTTIWDMCFDKNGNLYVVSHESNTGDNPRIQKFDTSHTCFLSFGTKGSGASQFLKPSGVAVDESLNIYIADKGNGRVQKFGSDGAFINSFSGSSSDSSKLESPEVICVYNNEVFVADYSNSQYFSTIKKFDGNGNFILKWGKKGDGDGEFLEINSLNVSSFGEIVVLDEYRIQFFTTSGSFIKIIDPFYDNKNYLLRDITIINSDICVSMSNGEIKLLKSGGLFKGIFQTSNQYISQITFKNKDVYISFFDNYKVKIFKMK